MVLVGAMICEKKTPSCPSLVSRPRHNCQTISDVLVAETRFISTRQCYISAQWRGCGVVVAQKPSKLLGPVQVWSAAPACRIALPPYFLTAISDLIASPAYRGHMTCDKIYSGMGFSDNNLDDIAQRSKIFLKI